MNDSRMKYSPSNNEIHRMKYSPRYYILKDGKEIEVKDPLEWAKQFNEENNRRIDLTKISYQDKSIEISTVFLGLDHQYGDGPPLLYESMVFAPDFSEINQDSMMDRYSTLEEAKAGHKEICQKVMEYLESLDPSIV